MHRTSTIRRELTTRVRQLVRGAWAPGPMRQYCSKLRAWHEFSTIGGSAPYPACPDAVLRFIAWRSRRVGFSAIQGSLAAIRMAHVYLELTPPTYGDRIYLALKGVRRIDTAAGSNRKNPIAITILRGIRCNLGRDSTSILLDALWTVSFALLLRKSEALDLVWTDVTRGDPVNQIPLLWIRIRHSKTDKYGRGYSLPLLCCCPGVCAYCSFLKWRSASRRSGSVVGSSVFPITYSELLRRVRSALTKLSLDPGEFGSHSYRRGGAEFLRDCAASDSIICQYGRWSYNGGNLNCGCGTGP